MAPTVPGPRPAILHTVRSLRVDGVVKVILRNLAHRDGAAFDHHVCALRDERDLASGFQALGIEPFFLGHAGAATTPRTVARLASLMRRLRVGVVHCNRTSDLAMAGTAARLQRIPVVSTLHWLGRLDEHPEDAGSEPLVARALEMHATVALNRALATRIVAVSDAVKTSFASLPGFPVDRTTVVYPGLDMAAREHAPLRGPALRASLGLAPDVPVLLNVGRLHAVKGQLRLVDMMRDVRARHPQARLLIAGEGALRGTLESAIAAAGLGDAIRLLGVRGDVDALLGISDVLVLASESEAAPLPLFEAMRAGRPVVATAVGGVAKLVQPGVTGIVVARGDAAAIAAAVLRVLDTPGLAHAMGEAARRLGQERFDVSVSVRTLERMYTELIARGPSRR